MKKFSDAFTQGGQTDLHKLHMIRQVIWATCKIALFSSAALFVLMLFYEQSWQDYYFLGAFYKALLRAQLDFLPRGFFDTTWIKVGNQWIEAYDVALIKHPLYAKFAVRMQAHVLHLFFVSAWVFVLIFTLISCFWVWRGKGRQKTKVLKGYELVKPKALIKRIHKIGASNIRIADISMPFGAECEHMMMTGTTGAGKTNAIHHLLAQIRALNHKAIIIDTNGGFVSRFFNPERDKLLNPFDDRTESWDLWQECREEYDFDEFAQSLIPTDKYDSFWTKAAQQLFSTAALKMKKNPTRSIEKLLHSLLTKPLKECVQEYENTYVSTYLDPAIEKTAMGIRATLVSALKNLKFLENKSQPDQKQFSIRAWMENDKKAGWLFLSALPTQRETLKPLMSAWLSISVKSLMSMGENPDRRLWFIVDELASLNRIPILAQGLAEVRKYGGCFVLSFQDLHQLDVLYGTQAARTLGALTGTKLVFRLDSYAAKQIAEAFGEQEVLEANESISFGAHQMRDGVSLSAQQHIRPLISPSEIMKLNNLEAYLKFPRNLPATKVTFPWYTGENSRVGLEPKVVEKADPVAEKGGLDEPI